jgi:hypothetical protein
MRLDPASRRRTTDGEPPAAAPRPATPRAAPPRPRQGVLFVAAHQRAGALRELGEGRHLVVDAEGAEPGHMRACVEDAVEDALARKGALPPGAAPDADARRVVHDQLYRVRALGGRGVVLGWPRLAGAADREGLLGVADSEALAAWLEAAEVPGVVVVIDERDRGVRLWSPRPLEDIAAELPLEGGASAPEPMEEPPAPVEAPPPVREGIRRAAPIADIAKSETEPPPPAQEAPRRAPSRVANAAHWRSFAVELDATRGPKPVSVVEKLFATRYMPLVAAAERGEADAAVLSVIEGWRSGFEHSYRDGFAQMRVTGKRPSMVLDAPELATRAARLNGARAVKLVLVDAMRFDVGERAMVELARLTAGRALCVDRALLWSALPTRTPTQLALLARGPEGLREPDLPPESEPELLRGRAVATLRRERIGARELLKLDVVEGRLRAPQPPPLDAIADEVAETLARHVDTLPPRTLLYVFGDHGFRLPVPAEGARSGGPLQGGASPEEVLVPAYAWLVGEVH